jgi:hypothetical protein
MRAGPFSESAVINLLNRAFVCVYTVNEDYSGKDPVVPAEERKELERIRQEGYKKKLSVGTVHAYVLTPDGHTHDSLHVASASTKNNTLAMLEKAVVQFKAKEGEPVVKPVPQSAPPKTAADALMLHLVSRGDDRGSWGEFPAENWIVLTREEWSKLIPADPVKQGQSWDLDREVSARVLAYFYPQTENNNATPSRIEKHTLKAKALSVKDGVTTARLDGTLKMQHAFYPGRPKETQPIEATVVGLMTLTPGKPPSLQLVTLEAVHGKRPFKTAVRTIEK